MVEQQPIYCLADSQLLFRQQADSGTNRFLDSVRERLPADPRAAYIGASNGDDPVAYSLFEAAMDRIDIDERFMVRSTLPAEDRDRLERADLILLAGGDPARGWQVLHDQGIAQMVSRRFSQGALLVGVSAGAVQLGWLTHRGRAPEPQNLVPTLRLVPAILGAHEEKDSWRSLRRLVNASGETVRGLGIPAGGGFIYHPDHAVQPLQRPLVELLVGRSGLQECLLLPNGDRREMPSTGGPSAVN